MALIAWPSSHGFIVLGRARVLGRLARRPWPGTHAPYPCPSCSLHRLHGLHRSHGLHHMALIAWPSSHGFIVLGRARVLGRLARRPWPRHPRPVSLSQAAHFIAFMVFIALMALIAWPSSHGFIVLGRARVEESSGYRAEVGRWRPAVGRWTF